MKKATIHKSKLTKGEITFTVSEKLNKLKGKVQAAKKPAEANKHLRKLKTPLPK
jgi:hypothetical protein